MITLYLLSCIPFVLPPLLALSGGWQWRYVAWFGAALVWPVAYVVALVFVLTYGIIGRFSS